MKHNLIAPSRYASHGRKKLQPEEADETPEDEPAKADELPKDPVMPGAPGGSPFRDG